MAIMRKADGVTQSWDEILALPQEEAEALVEQVGGTFAPRNGTQGLAVVELTPGEYVVVCFVPTGTSMSADGDGHGGHRRAALHERDGARVHGHGVTPIAVREPGSSRR